MGFAKYQFLFLNPANDATILFLDHTEPYRAKYEQILNGVGAITIEVPHTGADYFDTLPLDTVIVVQRILDESVTVNTDASYLLRSLTRVRVSDDERWIIGGLSLNHLLARRIIDPDDDPITSGGFVTRSGAADTVINDYVRYQAGPDNIVNGLRVIPDLEMATIISPMGKSVGRRLRYENLLKSIRDIAKVGNVDFRITRDLDGVGGMTFFVGRIGEDKSVATAGVLGPYTVLTPDRGNLEEPQYTVDRGKEVTIAYTLGEGDSVNRPVFKLSAGRENDSIYNRIEELVEVRTNETGSVQELLTKGQQALIKKKPERQLEFKIIPGAGGATYKTDLNLGDIITVMWESVEQTVRIQKIGISLSSAGEEIEFEVNDKDLNI